MTASLVQNALNVVALVSFVLTNSQPKFVDGLFNHPCTSATICVVEPQVLAAFNVVPIEAVALAVAAKSPPGVVHNVLPKAEAFQVASPGPAAKPWPVPPMPVLPEPAVPSPQASETSCKPMLVPPPPPPPPPEPATWPRNSTNCTLVIVAPAGTLAATLNSINPRRGEVMPLVPENMPGPPPSLLLTLF